MNYLAEFKRCVICRKKTLNWQKINGSPYHCFDGCKSTTGFDRRQFEPK